MAVVYIHGVAVRDQEGKTLESGGNQLLERLLENITWEMVESHLRRFIAPELSVDAGQVLLLHAYWGDLAADMAWGGASCMAETHVESAKPLFPLLPSRSHLVAELRQPLNQVGARFFGDVFSYINGRGDAARPGPIPQRILDTLMMAHENKTRTGEPLVVLTNSMGGQIMYDMVTYFLPRLPQYADVHIDFWCSVASQIGLFEELKLFLVSSPEYGKAKGNRVPFPDRRHLGAWWNVWDIDDIISYSVRDIIEGVDDTPFRVGMPLLKEHIGYLQEESFYRLFADKLRQSLALTAPNNSSESADN